MRRTRQQIQAIRERERQVLELSLRGLTLAQIATQLGYADESGARKAWTRAMRRVDEREREDLRKMQGERLQRYRAKLWGELAGREEIDPATGKKTIVYNEPMSTLLNTGIRIETREANLWGLDAAKKHEVSGADGGPVSIFEHVDMKEMETRMARLTMDEATLFIRLLNKLDGRGVDGSLAIEATALVNAAALPPPDAKNGKED